MTRRVWSVLSGVALVGAGLVAVATPAFAAPPPLSSGCQTVHSASNSTIVTGAGSLSLGGSFNVGEQVLVIGTTASSVAITGTIAGPGGTSVVHRASAQQLNYDIAQSGSYTFTLAPDASTSTNWHVDCGYPPQPSATVNGGEDLVYGQTAATQFTCAQQSYPVASCVDSNGDSDGAGSIDTTTLDFPQVGTYDYSVTATDARGLTATFTTQYMVIAATPVIVWADPAPMYADTPLSSTQLNASTPTTLGTFSYDPPAGTRFHPGTYTLTATFYPYNNYHYVTGVTKQVSLVVDSAPQSVSFTTQPPAQPTIGDTYTPAAMASSGQTPTLSAGPAGVCTYATQTGVVTFTGIGTCTVTAAQAGTIDYLPAGASQTIVVAKASTTLVAARAAKPLLGLTPTTFRATLTRTNNGAPIAGAIVSMVVAGHVACTGTTNSFGVATCSARIGVAAYLFTSSYTAVYVGSASYKPSTGTGRLG